MSDSPNKTCVVVGVGEGLGAALARRFAAGYKVALLARSADVIEKAADEIKREGGVALPLQSDATVEAQIAAAYHRITSELGPIEILIYNGGRRPMGRLMETTPQVFEETWRLHTFGAFLWARQVVPDMLSRGKARSLSRGGMRPALPPETGQHRSPRLFANKFENVAMPRRGAPTLILAPSPRPTERES